MRGSNTLSLILPLALLLSFCTSGNNKPPESEAEEPVAAIENKKDVSELTFNEVYGMVFGESGNRREWHGEEMPNTLTNMLSIATGEPCGEDNCGNALSITNNSDKSIGVVIKGAYDIEGDQGYMAVEYEITAGQSVNIGCSHLCYVGKSYLFDREIVGSWYMEE